MKTKKSTKADLKGKRMLFFEIGLLLSLSLCLYAFEWNSKEINGDTLGIISTGNEMEFEIPITLPEPPEPEPEPEPVKTIIEELNVIDDNKEIDDPLDDFTSEDNNKPIDPKIIIPDDIEPEPIDEKPVEYVKVEEKPSFPGGDKEILKFFSKNLVYPEEAKRMNIRGTIYVRFVISKTGKVENAEIIRGIDPLLNEEAMRVVKMMPPWSPGKQRGKPVPVEYTIPVTFKLI